MTDAAVLPAGDLAAALVPWLVFMVLAIMLLVPLVIVIQQSIKPGTRWIWPLAVGGAALAWLLVVVIIILLENGPGSLNIPLQSWDITPDFPFTTMLLVDHISWAFSAAIATLVLAVLLTAVMRPTPQGWQAWGGSLSLGGLALIAIWAGNPLTLLLAWGAIDILESLVLLMQVRQNNLREGISAALAARFAGVAVLIVVILVARSRGILLTFENIPDFINPYLLVAAGLRLGVLPIQLPFLSEPPMRRGVGTVLRMVPGIAALPLLVRTAQTPAPVNLELPLLALSGLAALYSAIAWLTAEDELSGRAYWILGMAALSVGAALRGDPPASLAWGLAMVYAGAQLFLFSARFRWIERLMFLGVVGMSAIPFTPSWAGARLLASGTGPTAILLILINALYFVGHVLLMLGYIRHFRRPLAPQEGFDPWTRLIYPVGLLLLPVSHWLFFLWGNIPDWRTAPPAMWWVPVAMVGLAVSAWFLNRGDPLLLPQEASFLGGLNWGASFWGRLLGLQWLYGTLFFLYRRIGQFLGSLGRLLEGDGSMLWTLLLLLLLYTLSISAFGGTGGL